MKIRNLILTLLIIIFCFTITPITMQNDTYYTIEIGKHILENGIDMQDPFSFHENLPYTYPHWAYDVATYLVYSVGQGISGEIGGYAGIYIITCILTSILGIALFKINKELSKNTLISFGITLITIYALRGYIAARAQLVTFILFALEIYFIESFLEEPKKRYILGLIAIPILIANLHLAVWWFYFIIYLPYIAEYILSKILKNQDGIILSKIKIRSNKNTKKLIIIMIVCLLTGLLTPLGTTPYTYLIKTMQGTTTDHINEHLPMTIINHIEPLISLIAIILILICTKTKIKLSDAFMLSGLTLLMLYSRRQQSLFFLICFIIINKLIYETLQNNKLINKIRNFIISKIGIALLSLIVILIGIYFIKEKEGETFVNKATYPVEASDWILNNLNLEEIKLFNEYNYGSYLLYRGIPVFIDSRADLYAPEFNTPTGKVEDGQDIFTDFIDASSLNVFYEDIFEKYDITHVILKRNSKINLMICNTNDGKYNCIYEDENFTIYKIEELPIKINLLDNTTN